MHLLSFTIILFKATTMVVAINNIYLLVTHNKKCTYICVHKLKKSNRDPIPPDSFHCQVLKNKYVVSLINVKMKHK